MVHWLKSSFFPQFLFFCRELGETWHKWYSVEICLILSFYNFRLTAFFSVVQLSCFLAAYIHFKFAAPWLLFLFLAVAGIWLPLKFSSIFFFLLLKEMVTERKRKTNRKNTRMRKTVMKMSRKIVKMDMKMAKKVKMKIVKRILPTSRKTSDWELNGWQ